VKWGMVVVEGQAEELFVNNVLAVALWPHGAYLTRNTVHLRAASRRFPGRRMGSASRIDSEKGSSLSTGIFRRGSTSGKLWALRGRT
jgi:hypothetical protein